MKPAPPATAPVPLRRRPPATISAAPYSVSTPAHSPGFASVRRTRSVGMPGAGAGGAPGRVLDHVTGSVVDLHVRHGCVWGGWGGGGGV